MRWLTCPIVESRRATPTLVEATLHEFREWSSESKELLTDGWRQTDGASPTYAGADRADSRTRPRILEMGKGPALLLIHGIGSRHETWLPVIEELAKTHTVIAPDLLGHGQSAKPRADYSIGGYANGMRDLLTVLGIEQVTVVGHSLGGGIAMQFAYQFPQRTERIVLVGTGGLGPEVNPVIPLCTVAGSNMTLAAITSKPVRRLGVCRCCACSRSLGCP